MTLEAAVQLQLGALDLDVALEIRAGEVVALLGPNGAGKTTLLRALAGLIPVTRGHVHLDGSGVARQRATRWLERVGLQELASARPSQLSGGQRQRAALARALAPDPRLLLLDEPMAALDASARIEVRRDLKRHLASFDGVRLLVTHDPLEAVALADRLVVIENGKLVQEGTPAEVTERPRSAYVADLVGVNLLRGVAEHGSVRTDGGHVVAAAGATSGEVFAVIHPRAVALHRQRPEGSPRNVWQGRADAIEIAGDRARVRVIGPVPVVAEITPASLAELRLAEGSEVWLSFKATDVGVYPA
ncbi:MAG: ABC transporter ATP-binding protein [Chloroflexi bacterium]|nr:MAG: ABC transporter ATP-binding protein [Chloroflexota bacterium]